MKTSLRKNSGFSLIEILISMGLVAILSLVVFSLNNFMNKGKMASETSYAADSFRKEIIALLNNPAAWKYTILGNPTFACVYNGTTCSGALTNGPPAGDYSYKTLLPASGPCVAPDCSGGFDVFSPSNTRYYKFASDAKAGFQTTGAQCTLGIINNNQPAPSAPGWIGRPDKGGKTAANTPANASICPFRMVLYWQPICPTTTTCNTPAIHVLGYTLYTPNPKDAQASSAFNPAQYGVDLILPPKFQ